MLVKCLLILRCENLYFYILNVFHVQNKQYNTNEKKIWL